MILDLKFKNQAKKIFLVFSLVFLAVSCRNQFAISNPQSEIRESAIQVRQMVEGDMADSLFNFYKEENKTALDLLKMGHKVETKTFSGVGEYVTSINGKKEDTGKNFWSFYVNNQQAQEGAATYKPKDKDFIEWKLEEIKK